MKLLFFEVSCLFFQMKFLLLLALLLNPLFVFSQDRVGYIGGVKSVGIGVNYFNGIRIDVFGVKGFDAVCVNQFGSGYKAFIGDESGCRNGTAAVPCRRATINPDAGDGQIDWPLTPNTWYSSVQSSNNLFNKLDGMYLTGAMTNSRGLFERAKMPYLYSLSFPPNSVRYTWSGFDRYYRSYSGCGSNFGSFLATSNGGPFFSAGDLYYGNLLNGGNSYCDGKFVLLCFSPSLCVPGKYSASSTSTCLDCPTGLIG